MMLEEAKSSDGHFLLREIRSLKGTLQYPDCLQFDKYLQLLLVCCSDHVYLLSLEGILKGAKQLLLHFTPIEMFSLMKWKKSEYCISDFNADCIFRNIYERCSVDEEIEKTQKCYEKIPIFHSCRLKHLKDKQYLLVSLFGSGQLIILLINIDLEMTCTVRELENLYLNDLILFKELEPQPLLSSLPKPKAQYPIFFSFCFVKTSLILVCHYSKGISFTQFQRHPARMEFIGIVRPNSNHSLCMKAVSISPTEILLILGLHDGKIAVLCLAKEENNFLLTSEQIIDLPKKSFVLQEPVTKIKVIGDHTVLISKGIGLFKFQVKEKKLELIYTHELESAFDSITGFTVLQKDSQVFFSTLQGSLLENNNNVSLLLKK